MTPRDAPISLGDGQCRMRTKRKVQHQMVYHFSDVAGNAVLARVIGGLVNKSHILQNETFEQIGH